MDTRRRPRRLFGLLGPDSQDDAAVFRDWHDFEWLIGHQGSALLRGPFARIRRLKPAQIADLLENASKEEETEILGQVHADPELEADVFEELDEDLATRLLGARTDEEIAAVLARMRADDAADAIAELPQRRRQPVLDLLPPGQRTKVLTLMGFNPTSAGGLMSMDFVAVPRMASVTDALARVREAVSLQPEALTSVHAVNDKGRLRGVARLVTLVQSDPDATLIDVSDTDPVRVGPDADITDVAVLMTDYNLITIPVVDDERRLLGVITVDDVLEVTLPGDWRRRETAEPPDAHYGDADREDAQPGDAPVTTPGERAQPGERAPPGEPTRPVPSERPQDSEDPPRSPEPQPATSPDAKETSAATEAPVAPEAAPGRPAPPAPQCRPGAARTARRPGQRGAGRGPPG